MTKMLTPDGMLHEGNENCSASNCRPAEVPWVPYTNKALRSITACEETGHRALHGLCPIHGGDACLYVYRHPDDSVRDGWKKGWR